MPIRSNKITESSQTSHHDEATKSVRDETTSNRSDPVRMGSPATDLQYQIETAFDEGHSDDSKWSTRKTFLFLILVCGTFWSFVGFAAFNFL